MAQNAFPRNLSELPHHRYKTDAFFSHISDLTLYRKDGRNAEISSDCAVCHNLDIEGAFFKREGGRYTRKVILRNGDEIQSSAKQGCVTCNILVEAVDAFSGKLLDARVHIIYDVGRPLRFESENLDLEFYVRSGICCLDHDRCCY